MELFQSFLFGLTIALAIGPIALLIINYGLNCGFKVAALSGTGAALADFAYSLIAFSAGAGLAVVLAQHQSQIELFASLVLLAFGGWMLLEAWKKRNHSASGQHETKCRRPLLGTFALTIVNPLTIILFVGFAGRSVVSGLPSIILNGLGVFAGSLIIQLSLALFGNVLKKFFRNNRAVFAFNVISSVAIIIFGLSNLF
ncbi:MAG: LysE family translocator [Chitinophagaceae bacterium]